MKNLNLIIAAAVIGLLVSCSTGSKAKTDEVKATEETTSVVKEETPNSGTFFVGKWKIIPSGLPGGDNPMIVSLERKDGTLTGTLKGENTPDVIEFYSITEKSESLTLNFKSGEHDVNMALYKKDDNNVTGSIMGMFNLVGSRVVE